MSMGWYRTLLPLCILTLLAASGAAADGNVTLQSLTIFNTHEWFGQKPNVYFQCQGEDRVDLPDVRAKDQLYTFLGEESWQPLTRLVGKKCKRCGIFEKDTFKSDDVFDQWELCPLNFTPSPDGLYHRFKENEFNLTFTCPTCNVVASEEVEAGEPDSGPEKKEKSHGHELIAVIVVFALLSLGGFAFVAYSGWRRKQREMQQARFIKLFESDDFLDDELGLKDDL
ncbi:uncharacterized protein [Physcomitrium patens]|uniref:DUF7953 domain-containing protein n=1 Tax=Physcomitrium patens TaxID=3218 RepID=A0A2K1L067_PHYPA|nr:uncharacterized protein LOC112293752 [Physcomitrium patens]PNR59418.1 hypothetical protein PHYPA_002209 [Physcomitrium patens]|eukprot:XP_024399326.1 uncharacterized protein LOC112293752 [Physcomitrella patens]